MYYIICSIAVQYNAENKEQEEVKAFQATTEHDQLSDYRDGAAVQVPSVTSNQSQTPKGRRGFLFPPGQQAQENGRDQTSHMVPGSKPAQNIAPQPSTAVPESNIAWKAVIDLTSILSSEKKEKMDTLTRKKQKESELKAEIQRVESDLKGEIEELEKKEKEARSELKEQERVYQEAKKELRDKENEIFELRASLRVKTGELEQEREKQEELKRAEEELKKEKESVTGQRKRLEKLKEEAEKANAEYVKALREERARFSVLIKSINTHMEEYKAMMQRTKQRLECRNRWTQYIILALLSTTVVLAAILVHILL